MTTKVSSRGWSVYAGVLICIFFYQGFVGNVQGLLIEPVTSDLGISRTLYSTFMSLSGLINLVASFFFAQFVARLGVKKMMVVGSVGVILYFVCFELAGMMPAMAAPLICIGQICLGVMFSWASLMGASILINTWFAKRENFLIGIAVAMSSLGGVIASPLVTYLILNLGWRTDMLIRMVLVIIVAVILFVLIKNAPAQGESRIWDTPENAATAGDDAESTDGQSGLMLAQAMKTKNFWFAIAFSFLFSCCIYPGFMLIATYAMDLGYAEYAGVIMSMLYVIAIIGTPTMGGIFDKFGTRVVLTVVFLVLCVGLYILSMGSLSLPMLFVGALAIGLNFAILQTAVPALVREVFGLKDFARVQSYVFTASILGCTVSLPAYNAVFDVTGSYAPVFLATIPLVIVSIVLLFVATSKIKSTQK